MYIAGKPVGGEHPCFIIAEAGSNHNRDLKLAYQLIDAARQAGADAVKFQLFQGEKHYSRRTPDFEYLKNQGIRKNIVDLLKEIELPRDWLEKLRDHAARAGIILFSSVTSREDVDLAASLALPAYKLASFEITDLQLIEYTAARGKPIILSTGLTDMEDIADACQAVARAGNDELVLLQCASAYPAASRIMNLRAMGTLSRNFNVITGLSDHTAGILIAPAAVAMGAKVVEKHFTVSRSLPGPDHSFAVEPSELKRMVDDIREVEAALGDGSKKGPSPDEMEMFEKARRSLHAQVTIPAGEVITAAMLTVKRPGYGIKPKLIDQVIGRVARVTIGEDEPVTWDKV